MFFGIWPGCTISWVSKAACPWILFFRSRSHGSLIPCRAWGAATPRLYTVNCGKTLHAHGRQSHLGPAPFYERTTPPIREWPGTQCDPRDVPRSPPLREACARRWATGWPARGTTARNLLPGTHCTSVIGLCRGSTLAEGQRRTEVGFVSRSFNNTFRPVQATYCHHCTSGRLTCTKEMS